MSSLRLEELLDFEGTAAWRFMKAEQFPNDLRNAEAAEHLGKLAESLPSLNGSSLHKRISCVVKSWMNKTHSGCMKKSVRCLGLSASTGCLRRWKKL